MVHVSRAYGDFQTPPELVEGILGILGPIGQRWSRVLEPTCGIGNFISGLIGHSHPPSEIKGYEINPSHVYEASGRVGHNCGVTVQICETDVFRMSFRNVSWKSSGPLLVLGNPPWVTNAELGSMGSTNLPEKHNFRKLPGIAALTGASNFDLAESLVTKLLVELEQQQPTIALLCKTVVARNAWLFAREQGMPITRAEIRRIDAQKWFRAAVDACLLILQVGEGSRLSRVALYSELSSRQPEQLISDAVSGGISPVSSRISSTESPTSPGLVWRQGVKHNAASIMELSLDSENRLRNKSGDIVDVENQFLYPLMKSSDIFHGRTNGRRVIVPQKRVGENTARIRSVAPKLWAYLRKHRETFRNRKSSVFKGKPDYSIFGIGPYAFALYKVAIAGFYPIPRFRVVGPVNGRPVMLDDTCYYVACESQEQAEHLAEALNHPECIQCIESLVWKGSKRPITKALLQRIHSVLRVENPPIPVSGKISA